MDAFELLKKDHKKVSKLFSEIESASGQAKKQLFARLKDELDLHAHIEETVLYPALENTDEAREITLEAYEEHKVVKDLLGELAGAAEPNDEWDAKLKVLKENVEHHVEEEEGELFGKARKALSKGRIEQLGVELEAEKASKLGGSLKPQTTQPDKAKAAKDKQAAKETPGVLQKLANLIGLGDSGPAQSKSSAKTSQPRSGKASTTSSTPRAAAKTKPASKAGKTAKRPGRSTKPATKAAPKKSAGKARGSSKATRGGTTKQPARGARSSASKSAPRPAGNQKARGSKRSSKSSSKARAKQR